MSLFNFWIIAFTTYFTIYLIANGSSFWLFWIHKFNDWQHIKIQQGHTATKKQCQSEFLWSTCTILTFSIVLTISYALYLKGITQVYDEITQFGWPYFILSIVLLILLHSTYFYWTHRLLHTQWLLRNVHIIHHRSRSPTPLAAYAFHPIEALILVTYIPIIIFIFPVHPAALLSFILIQHAYNTLGHLGFEVLPQRISTWHITPTHHDLHHKHFQGGYGIYFDIWDKLMHTNFKNYQQTLTNIKKRKPTKPQSKT